MKFNSRIDQGRILAYAPASLFSKEAVFKCLYWYGDKFVTSVDLIGETYEIELTPGNEVSQDDLPLYQHKLSRDLIDFNLRDIVVKETQNVRDLLVAKAFSNGEFDEEPVGDVADPVGYESLS